MSFFIHSRYSLISTHISCSVITSNDNKHKVIYSETVQATEDGNYIECEGDQHCDIECAGDNICRAKTIQCPRRDDTCSIECRGDGSCQDSTIYCPDNADCHLTCHGKDACRNVDIHWASKAGAHDNTLICDDDESNNSCLGVKLPPINAPSDYQEMRLECWDNECRGKHINCPLHTGCHIKCFGKDSCVDTEFNWIDDMPHSLNWGPIPQGPYLEDYVF